MMNEEEFLDFSKTCKGGKLTHAASQLKCNSMTENKMDDVYDFKGGDIRFRVSVKDIVIFRNAFKRSKNIELKNKAVRNPNEDQVSKMLTDIQKGHDNGLMLDMEETASCATRARPWNVPFTLALSTDPGSSGCQTRCYA